MKQRALIVFAVLAALACLVLMLLVSLQVRQTRTALQNTGIDVFNFTIQATHNAQEFVYQVHEASLLESPAEAAVARDNYLTRFDVLWSLYNGLNTRLMGESYTEESERVQIIDQGRELIENLDPLMSPDIVLTTDQANQIIGDMRKVIRDVHSFGLNHFVGLGHQRDEIKLRTERLNRAFGWLALLLLLAGSFVFTIVYRANREIIAQTSELELAHKQLTHVVDELRSGHQQRVAKNQFIAAASHDLRQPLHAMGLFLESLEKTVESEEAHLLTGKIRQSTAALNNLLNSLLDVSRLDAGMVVVERKHFRLSELLNLLGEEFGELAEQQQVEISIVAGDHVVYSDTVLLLRIVRNLLRNAVLHAPGCEVRIVARDSGEGIELCISDNGPGIPLAQQELVFSEYFQLNNPERDRNKGLGLGLSIVRRLATLLGVSVRLDSDTGAGTRFYLQLPRGDVALIEATRAAEAGDDFLARTLPEGLKVLVIDDERDIRLAMQHLLVRVGCQVLVCESASDAREQIVESGFSPDVLIADYRLRDHSTGLGAIDVIREELNAEVPALLVTGDTSSDRLQDASASGVPILHKPVTADELLSRMHQLLQQQRNLVNLSGDADLAVNAAVHQPQLRPGSAGDAA